jgi:Ni,Fe-hydrogenase III large subunit/Ni,Fe-hydrogenase III component G
MKLGYLLTDFDRVPGAVPAYRAAVDAAGWLAAAEQIAREGGRLVALWGAERPEAGAGGAVVYAAFVGRNGMFVTELEAADSSFPDLSRVFPAAARMQRATHDLLGVRAVGAADERPWLRHGAWPADVFPLRASTPATATFPPEPDDYPFVTVTGDGVHEIAVGPVHAGTIEPGHFRFSVVGERLLRLEARLGYKHKGIEKSFINKALDDGARLAGRISGDSTVAYGWAYAMAIESAAMVDPPARAVWLRALLLERERIANHLGDLGFLGNDAGLAFGLTQFLRLKEDVLRLNHALFGHRYLMDAIVPGGVARDLDANGARRILDETAALETGVRVLKDIYEDHPGLQDRFINCGRVTPDLAVRLGLTGFAGRASAVTADIRVQHPHAPYRDLEVNLSAHRNGDVAARVSVRFDEISESLRLTRCILARLPAGAVSEPLPPAPSNAFGIGWIEGWRGEVLIALETGAEGRIGRLHAHDPSWQNWPVLEHAVLDNIVPDFPLINKSFNLSYAGHDL